MVTQLKCPSCGAAFVYHPGAKKQYCEYCMTEFTDEQLQELLAEASSEPETPPKSEEMGRGAPEGMKVEDPYHFVGYLCGNCGAEVITDETTTATNCYYCHSPVVLTDRIKGDHLPGGIIPFKISREEAISRFKEWTGKKMFVQKEFLSEAQLDNLNGLYLPFWKADADIHFYLKGRGTKVSVYESGDREYTETQHFRIERGGDISLFNLLELANDKVEKKKVHAVLPYHVENAVAFSPAYLAGFLSEDYNITSQKVAPILKQEATDQGKKMVQNTCYQYTSVTWDSVNMPTILGNWQYVLLPLWFMTYKYRDKMYIYAVNGEEGNIVGELPLDKVKLNLVRFGSMILLLLLGFIMWRFLR